MQLFDFKCDKCESEFKDVLCEWDATGFQICEHCGEVMRRLYTGMGGVTVSKFKAEVTVTTKDGNKHKSDLTGKF